MSDSSELLSKAKGYMQTLCIEIEERSVGSEGNLSATHFFNNTLISYGWRTEIPQFNAIDWHDNGATLQCYNANFNVLASPYSLGCNVSATLVDATKISELEESDCSNQILFLHGEIAKQQLMPKNFIFYNPEEDKAIITFLEKKRPKAIICATSRNPALAGGVYPFPLIEDGDFDIPSVYMTDDEGEKLKLRIGETVNLISKSERIPSSGYNVIGRKGAVNSNRVVITAHIDAKKGTPGAIDNATGVTILLLLSDLLKDYSGNLGIELVALNGEDYFSVPGQMNYINSNQNRFNEIALNINIDGAGYINGPSSISLFDLPENLHNNVLEIASRNGIVEDPQWPQGDHSIFVQYGRPAIAISSHWFIENITDQNITHTSKDNLDIVDCRKLVELAIAIKALIIKMDSDY